MHQPDHRAMTIYQDQALLVAILTIIRHLSDQ